MGKTDTVPLPTWQELQTPCLARWRLRCTRARYASARLRGHGESESRNLSAPRSPLRGMLSAAVSMKNAFMYRKLSILRLFRVVFATFEDYHLYLWAVSRAVKWLEFFPLILIVSSQLKFFHELPPLRNGFLTPRQLFCTLSLPHRKSTSSWKTSRK